MNGMQWTGAALGAATLLLTETALAQCHDCDANLSLARMHLVASAALGDCVFFAGGRGLAGNMHRYDIYNACADSWSWLDFGTSHEQGVAIAGCGKVWFAGGTTTGSWWDPFMKE